MFGSYFGDYLLKKQLISTTEMKDILSLPYSESIQKLTESNRFTLEDLNPLLDGFQNEYGFSDEELAALKSGDLKHILPIFIYFDPTKDIERNLTAFMDDGSLTNAEDKAVLPFHSIPNFVMEDPQLFNRYICMAFNYLTRIITGKILIKRAFEVQKHDFEALAYQQLTGAHHIFLGFSGNGDSLLALANPFAKKEFDPADKRIFDSVCELINCINGAYASELSNESIYLEIDIPHFYENRTLSSNAPIYCLPIVVEDKELCMLLSMNAQINIE